MIEVNQATNSPPPDYIYDVLKFCTWKECVLVTCLCKRWEQAFSGSKEYWKFMCMKLAEEKRLYFPDTANIIIADWKTLFFELYALHKSDNDQFSAADDQVFSVKVCARFRPKVATAGGNETDASQVVLPLYQRIQLVKAAQGPACTTSEAMKIIMTERGRPPIADPYQDAAVRCRETKSESTSGREGVREGGRKVEHKVQVLEVNEAKGTVLTVGQGVGLREFSFEKVFDLQAEQETVYVESSQRMVMDFMNGYNGAVIVYGQTGSGKTHTMFGPDTESLTKHSESALRMAGIVPRACQEVLQAMETRSRDLEITSSLSISYIEVFGSEMFDLLKEGELVGQSRVAGQRYVLDGGAAEEVCNMTEVRKLLARGELHKRRAATAMNERSSRAHSVIIMTLNQSHPSDPVASTSRLFLADLGGSEKLSKSKVDEGVKAAGTTTWEEYYESHERLTEAANINIGLFALKKCIDGLNDRQRAKEDGRPPPYIPYQDSKLTMLLSAALGGNSKCAVLVTASLEPQNALETLQTLRFAERCANVENRTALTAAALRAALEKLDAEIKHIEEVIAKKERWESKVEMRPDMVDGAVTGYERVTVSALVGAEVEREELEKLLKRRRELMGELREESPEDEPEDDEEDPVDKENIVESDSAAHKSEPRTDTSNPVETNVDNALQEVQNAAAVLQTLSV